MESTQTRIPWNKGKIVGQKPALKLQEVWAIRVRLQLKKSARDLALVNLAIDPQPEDCSIDELLQDIAQKYALTLANAELRLVQDCPADLCLIERAVNNLIDNAIRHTPEGGEVTPGWLEVCSDQIPEPTILGLVSENPLGSEPAFFLADRAAASLRRRRPGHPEAGS